MRETVRIREVGLRDGLQLVATVVPTVRKLDWCRTEAAAGMREFEVTAFVPPSIGPQFTDAVAIVAGTLAIPGIAVSALVPNLKGAQRAAAAGTPKVNYVLSASEQHNLANVRRSTAESLDDFRRILDERRAGNLPVAVAGGIATAFGCTIQGDVPEGRVVEIAAALAAAGADEIIVADTVGYGSPAQVRRILTSVLAAVDGLPVFAHFHDTRGLGLANATAALEAGVRRFDASLAGLGGCPFAPGATGNINTEDLAFLLESLGLDTGLDIEALVALRARVEPWLPGERFSGAIARAGLPKTFRRAA